MFEDGLEQCKTSAEFLLNPWVLMQLPWHPVLLLQWTAGVLTEYNSLRLELVEFYRWPMPSHRHTIVVNKLFEVVYRLHCLVLQPCLTSLKDLHFDRAMENKVYSSAKKFLSTLTNNIVPLLEFVVSGKARDIARALKRMIFGSNFQIVFKKNSSGVPFIAFKSCAWESRYNCIFSDHFWQQGIYRQIMGMTVDELLEKKEFQLNLGHGSGEFLDEATPDEWIAQMETKYGKKIELEKVCTRFSP